MCIAHMNGAGTGTAMNEHSSHRESSLVSITTLKKKNSQQFVSIPQFVHNSSFAVSHMPASTKAARACSCMAYYMSAPWGSAGRRRARARYASSCSRRRALRASRICCCCCSRSGGLCCGKGGGTSSAGVISSGAEVELDSQSKLRVGAMRGGDLSVSVLGGETVRGEGTASL